jgi:hypothetical protein
MTDNLIADSVAILAPFKKSDPFVREKASKYLKMAAAKNLPEVSKVAKAQTEV